MKSLIALTLYNAVARHGSAAERQLLVHCYEDLEAFLAVFNRDLHRGRADLLTTLDAETGAGLMIRPVGERPLKGLSRSRLAFQLPPSLYSSVLQATDAGLCATAGIQLTSGGVKRWFDFPERQGLARKLLGKEYGLGHLRQEIAPSGFSVGEHGEIYCFLPPEAGHAVAERIDNATGALEESLRLNSRGLCTAARERVRLDDFRDSTAGRRFEFEFRPAPVELTSAVLNQFRPAGFRYLASRKRYEALSLTVDESGQLFQTLRLTM